MKKNSCLNLAYIRDSRLVAELKIEEDERMSESEYGWMDGKKPQAND